MDKLEITAEAQRLRTFEISIEPDADCCTLFVPRHPATRVSADEIVAAEARLELPRLITLGVEGARLETFEFPAAAVASRSSRHIPRSSAPPGPSPAPSSSWS